ncbi:MAG: hypothetical protein C5B57_06070 [Blastocatellia bacterium]|nr:MAG: hypothetical protein C5B57_06070 [Blastocatellia bacterium]
MLVSATAIAQQRGQPAPGPPPTPRAAAPLDLTGYWVSIVTEDWRWRMMVPRKGDYASVPLSAEGKRVADTWDPAKVGSDGCKPYGAAAIMRVPGRLHITWEGDNRLKVETDAGQQTRLFNFDKPATPSPTIRTWQGHSVAEWEHINQPGGLAASLQQAPAKVGSLKVVTTNLRAGYLRKNGVQYSEETVVTEYFDRLESFDTDWLTVLTIVQDPKYLSQQFVTSTHFKREPDASKWMPTPCEPAGRTPR